MHTVPFYRGLRFIEVNSVIGKHEPIGAKWSENDVLSHLARYHHAFLFANFRHAGLEIPDQSIVGVDHYSQMPSEISENYSLHTITSTDRVTSVYRELRDKDAVVCAVPLLDATTSVKEARFHLAWFARPSVLAGFLQQSPKEFSEVIIKPFQALFISDEEHGWSIWAKCGFDIAKFGLEDSSTTQKW